MEQLESVVNVTLELNNISDNNSYIHQEQLLKLYEKFSLLYAKGHKYISLDSLYGEVSISDCEIEIIKTRKDLFYLCTPKRAMLVVWVINTIKNFFVINGMPQKVSFYEIFLEPV